MIHREFPEKSTIKSPCSNCSVPNTIFQRSFLSELPVGVIISLYYGVI